MCLGIPIPEAEKQAIIEAGKRRGYIRVWKVVSNMNGAYSSPYYHRLHKSGIRRAYFGYPGGNPGWHGFLDRQSVKEYYRPRRWVIIECLAKPEWLRSAGVKDSWCHTLKTATFTKLMFPEYPRRRVTVNEFKEAIRA